MENFHFKIATDKKETNIYVLADSYNSALDKLFNDYEFYNYQFQGIKNTH
jgi:hypothetical protein